MKDRVSTQVLANGAIRYGIYNADGSLNRYEYIKAEDLPTEVGSVLNKANILPDGVKALLALSQTDPQIADALTKLSGAALRNITYTQLSTLADGTVFQLDEIGNGTLVDFIKLKNNYEGSGRVAVIRKNSLSNTVVWDSVIASNYADSDLGAYLNTTYLNSLGASISSQISNVGIKVYSGSNRDTTVTTLSTKIFVPSAVEKLNSYGSDGTLISGLANLVYVSNHKYWTRTPESSASYNYAITFDNNGNYSNAVKTTAQDVFPMFTLPADFGINPVNNITDMLGNAFALPYCKIAIGSYTGAGVYGSANKNNLVAPFLPKLIVIMRRGVAGYNTGIILVPALTGLCYNFSNQLTVSLSGNTTYWYHESNEQYQLNSSGAIYDYLILG